MIGFLIMWAQWLRWLVSQEISLIGHHQRLGLPQGRRRRSLTNILQMNPRRNNFRVGFIGFPELGCLSLKVVQYSQVQKPRLTGRLPSAEGFVRLSGRGMPNGLLAGNTKPISERSFHSDVPAAQAMSSPTNDSDVMRCCRVQSLNSPANTFPWRETLNIMTPFVIHAVGDYARWRALASGER
jgi:hypothetical protein